MKGRGGRMLTKTPMPAGWPDEAWHRNGTLILVELKSDKGYPRDDQRARLTALSGYQPDDQWNSWGDKPTATILEGRIRVINRDPLTVGPFLHTANYYVGLWRPRHWTHALACFERL